MSDPFPPVDRAVPAVYAAINAVQAELCVEGISKSRKNDQQGYSFRGIDDMFNVISPLMAKHGLCILPSVMTRDVQERISGNGKALFYVTIEAEFDFVAVLDGSLHIVRTFGEAMDSGDKATNKAMSAAYKYAVMQAFAIPTQGDNDADSTTHEVSSLTPALAHGAITSAGKGMAAYTAWWTQLTTDQKRALGDEHEKCKKLAQATDAAVVK